MDRQELVLSILASGQGQHFTPVQIQMAAFPVTRNLPEVINRGATFTFSPYDYGPLDSSVYTEASRLAAEGLASISTASTGRWNLYAATDKGIARGEIILAETTPTISNYIGEVAQWVRKQSFSGLVKSIYDAYPEMKVNSVFRG